MYVISQEGDITINVKSTVGFKAEYCEFNGKWEIRTIFPDCEYLIGKYDTEEKAKKVYRSLWIIIVKLRNVWYMLWEMAIIHLKIHTTLKCQRSNPPTNKNMKKLD